MGHKHMEHEGEMFGIRGAIQQTFSSAQNLLGVLRHVLTSNVLVEVVPELGPVLGPKFKMSIELHP